jgi:hypothetical protein
MQKYARLGREGDLGLVSHTAPNREAGHLEDKFCNDVGAQFQPGGGETLYCVSDMSTARIALERDPCWFNASLEKPQWPDGFDPKQWEIVPVNL